MLSKTYSSAGRSCRVTFELPRHLQANAATLVGEFNQWDPAALPMKRRKDGAFRVQVTLDAGQSYRFRYLLDDGRWENDDAADGYTPNPFGSDDSVVNL